MIKLGYSREILGISMKKCCSSCHNFQQSSVLGGRRETLIKGRWGRDRISIESFRRIPFSVSHPVNLYNSRNQLQYIINILFPFNTRILCQITHVVWEDFCITPATLKALFFTGTISPFATENFIIGFFFSELHLVLAKYIVKTVTQ